MINAPVLVLILVVVSGGGVAWVVVSARTGSSNEQWWRFAIAVDIAHGIRTPVFSPEHSEHSMHPLSGHSEAQGIPRRAHQGLQSLSAGGGGINATILLAMLTL